MSGIAATYDLTGAPVTTLDLAPLLAGIAHRGPLEATWAGDCLALGQRTLPVTPEAALEELPVGVGGGMCQLALDGHLDNRDDITSALGIAPGGPALTDAELIALSYERWGERCVQRLIGDFAFVLWDRRRYRLLAARDQRGFRPLVYARAGPRLLFGSEPRQLLAVGGLSRDIDRLFLACHLTGAAPPEGLTPYEAVREVPPAHYLVAEGGNVRLREYWRLGPRPLLRYRRREEYVEHFEETFGLAVSATVRSPSPPAVLLSGGLDSSYVLARAAERRSDVFAYTAYAEGTAGMDERVHSTAVAEHLGVALRQIEVSDCWSLSSKYLPDAAFDQPDVPMQAPLMVRMAEAARRDGANVIIDGIGGDEFLAGPTEYLALLIVTGHWLQAAGEARAWARRSGLPLTRILRRGALVPLLSTLLRSRYRALRGRAPLSAPPPWIDAAALRNEGLEAALRLTAPSSSWLHRNSLGSFWSFHTGMGLPVLAWRERRALLPMGAEARSPLWDLRLVELALRTPSWVHRGAGEPKALLRLAMRHRLPNAVVDRQDKGTFDELMNTGLLERERERVEEALRGGPLARLPYVKGPALDAELDAYRRYQHPWWHALWRATTAGLWLRLNEVSRGHTVDRLVKV